MWTRISGSQTGASVGLFSFTAKFVMSLEVKYLDANNNKALYLDTLTADAKGNSASKIFNDGMPKLMHQFAEQFKPDELVK